jgi:dihydroorotate dehydrogenase
MGASPYERIWPLLRLFGAEGAHRLAMGALHAPFPLVRGHVADPFEWRGHVFPNRVGIAAGFDKNAALVRGMAGLGAGFAEVGTVLNRPWSGQSLRPRMDRDESRRAVWNRLGFPSQGVAAVAQRLSRARPGPMRIACNIAPHPLTVKEYVAGADFPRFAEAALAELIELVDALYPFAAFFVINLSSPNTAGLRSALHGPGFAEALVAPLRARLAERDGQERRAAPTLLLVKLPPEDAEGASWTVERLEPLLKPLADASVCDGFVAVNTSIRLARENVRHATPEAPGGLSGAPLLPLAQSAMGCLAELALPEQLRIGVGGVLSGDDAVALAEAGAHLIEIYSGMIYRGPGLLMECARALRDAGS